MTAGWLVAMLMRKPRLDWSSQTRSARRMPMLANIRGLTPPARLCFY
ncbi:MAG: hypothetical protein K8R36_25350 [Planctomycetales bacterium]|nr:hypothetical protein [Planctomycetales bacterium]